MAKLKNLLGRRFGKLTVIERAVSENHMAKWKCRCDCGKTTKTFGYHLLNGTAKSCGCPTDSKQCKNCETIFQRQADENDYSWRNRKHCSVECRRESSAKAKAEHKNRLRAATSGQDDIPLTGRYVVKNPILDKFLAAPVPDYPYEAAQ